MFEKTVNKHASEVYGEPPRQANLKAVYACPDEYDARLKISCEEEGCDPDDVRVLSLPYKAWDDKTKQYVASNEAQARCEENLSSIGLAFTDLNSQLPVEFEGWVQDDGTVTLWEPKAFVQTAGIQANMAHIRNALRKNTTFVTLPFTEWKGVRFDCPILIDIDGKLTPVRVSQLIIENAHEDGSDHTIKLKYERGEGVNMRVQIEAHLKEAPDSLSPEQVEHVKRKSRALINGERARVLKEFKTYIGHDLEEMIENGESLTIEARLRTDNAAMPYITGTVV